MCGIAGTIVLSNDGGTQDHSEVVASMVSSMKHRGPDTSGVGRFDRVYLGSCRLSILGLDSSSNQPMTSSDSKCTLVYNGEIYKYIELREELRARWHRFVSSGDTEVVLHAYDEWGPECLSRFNGIFAFALFDGLKGRVFFARDRFGVKPFCYSRQDGLFLFASEPEALLRAGLVPRDPDMHTVEDYLRFGVTDTEERTFFLHINQLPAGHYGIVEGGRIEVVLWHDAYASVTSSNGPRSDGVFVAEFKRRFEGAVAFRFRSDVPVGILLSGGLDSSSITAVSAKLPHPESLRSFVVSFPGSKVDERRFAEAMASKSGIPLTAKTAPEMNMAWVDACLRTQGEPFISPSIIAQWLVMKTVQDSGIRVLLTGQGADEYLGGYQYFESYAVAEMLSSKAFGAALAYLLDERNAPRILTVVAQVLFLALPTPLKLLPWRKRWMKESRGLGRDCPYEGELLSCHGLRDALLFHLRRRLPELLRYEDRNSMAFSIETRHPFLDHTLVELALNSPTSMVVGENVRKRILRLAMEGELPPTVLNRKDKIGFEVPDTWLRSEAFRKAFRELCSQAPAPLLELVDVKRACALLRHGRSRRALGDLWRIYCVLMWYRQWVSPSGNEAYGPPSSIQDASTARPILPEAA